MPHRSPQGSALAMLGATGFGRLLSSTAGGRHGSGDESATDTTASMNDS